MSGNDEEEYNIINGVIPAPRESYYKHKKQGTKYSKRVQKELNNTELKVKLNYLALELGKQKAINRPLQNIPDNLKTYLNNNVWNIKNIL